MKFFNSILLATVLYGCMALAKAAGVLKWFREAKDRNRVLYLSPFFPENAGFIYRAQKWAEIFKSRGYDVEIKNTLSKEQYYDYFSRNDTKFYTKTLIKRTWQVLTSYRYSIVIVRRELLQFNDYGNLFLEKALLKIHPDAILDFDDDISAAKQEPREVTSTFGKLMFENGTKFLDSLQLYRNFIVGSRYLREFVLRENKYVSEENICVIPTCVDYESHPQKVYQNPQKSPIVLGWIGSNGNLPLLEEIIPQIDQVNKEYPLKLLVISGKEIQHDVGFEIENRMWSYETQIADLLEVDIGLMPLNDTLRERGKCGFKLIQYMGLGIVSVAGAITVNREIVEDGIEGFLVEDPSLWINVLSKAIDRRGQFPQIGESARRKIQSNYSFVSNEEKYIEYIAGVLK